MSSIQVLVVIVVLTVISHWLKTISDSLSDVAEMLREYKKLLKGGEQE